MYRRNQDKIDFCTVSNAWTFFVDNPTDVLRSMYVHDNYKSRNSPLGDAV